MFFVFKIKYVGSLRFSFCGMIPSMSNVWEESNISCRCGGGDDDSDASYVIAPLFRMVTFSGLPGTSTR